MSYENGIAAINLDMPPRVPRTEYSAHTHWDLVNTVCGTEINSSSNDQQKAEASSKFIKAWKYDFMWSILIHRHIFDGFSTLMGHAEYATDGSDFNNNIRCPFSSPEQVLAFDPWQQYGQRDMNTLIKNFDEHYSKCCEKTTDTVNMTGIYVTCVSGLIEIFGWDMMLMAAGTDPEGFGKLTDRYASWIQQYFDALAQCKSPVVMVHDDIVWSSGAFISPDWYKKHVFANYKKYFEPLLEAGKKIIYTSDGNYTEFIDDIAETGVHGFVMEPTTDMKYIAQKYGKTHIFIGNADCRILTYGSKEDIYNEVKRCMHIGKDCPGFFMAVGNHIPSSVPVENAIYYNEVYNKLGKR